MRGLRQRGARALLVAAATLAAVALAWARFAPVDPVAVLDAHAGSARWSEGRSALSLGWRPFDDDEKLRDYLKVQRALLERQPFSDRALDLSLSHFYLWRGDTGDLDRAEARLASIEQDAVTLNERALVLHEQGRTIGALDAALHALQLEPALAAALFNRALFSQRLHLDRVAERAWEAFLTLEPDGPWADEARAHLSQLLRPATGPASLAQRFEEFERSLRNLRDAAALERLLADPDTRETLDALEREGERLSHTTIEWMRTLDAAGWRRYAARAARYAPEVEKVLAGDGDPARLDRLSSTEAPLLAVHFARLGLYDAVQRTDLARTERLVFTIRSLCARHGCREAAILALSDLASTLEDSGRYHEAEELLERAAAELPDFASERRAEIAMKRAALAIGRGAYRRGLRLNQEAISVLREIPGTTYSLASALYNAAVISRRLGFSGTAMAFVTEARDVAEEIPVARIVHRAAWLEAVILADAGRIDEAADRLQESLPAVRAAALPGVLRSHLLELARLRLRQDRARDAIDAVDEALALVVTDAAVIQPALLITGAHARFALGDEGAGMVLLERAAAAANDAIGNAPDALAARHYATEWAPILAEHAARQAARGAVEAVWTEVGGAELRPLDADECFAAILRLEEGFGVWIADRTGTRFARAPALRSPLERDGCPADTRRLTILDRPGSSALSLSRLVRKGHPDVAVVLAASPAAPWPADRIGGTGLAVHSPQPVRLDLGLGFLPAAPREAAALLRALPGSEELRGEAATPAAVIEQASAHELLHFGVHGVSHQANGAASFLLLGGERGHLEATDILSMPLAARRPVVVLTACRSGAGDGPVELDGGGLPWAFRQAGARAVISYQDALEDEAARLFSETFYEALRGGAGLSEAFERGVARVREERSPEAAAAFVLGV